MKLDTIPQRAIDEFGTIYTKLYNKKLSPSELASRADNFLQLYHFLATHTQKEDVYA